MFCTDPCHKQPLGKVLHSVEICFVTSLLKSISCHVWVIHFSISFGSMGVCILRSFCTWDVIVMICPGICRKGCYIQPSPISYLIGLWGIWQSWTSNIHMLQINFMRTCEIVLRWMPTGHFHDKSKMVLVLACRQQHSITWANVDPDRCRHKASLDQNASIWGHPI